LTKGFAGQCGISGPLGSISQRAKVAEMFATAEDAAVTGGKQMDGFVQLVGDTLIASRVPESCISTDKRVELPG
jgi:hypothetical protein